MHGFPHEKCPECGTGCRFELECPGWPDRDGKIMVCVGCGNAEAWYCSNKDCDWWYREPNGRRDVDTMGTRPPWLKPSDDD